MPAPSAPIVAFALPLHAQNISFAYTRGVGRPVLDSVSMSLEPGRITAIAGPNGAGKSTLLRLLMGLLRPATGRVLLDDQPVRSLPHRIRARRIAYVPQRTSLVFGFTVREYVRLGRFASSAADHDSAVARAMARVDIADRAADPLPVLSAGQQQRATLARALAQLDGAASPGAPQILLADEPVSAMDPRHALLTMGILKELARAGLAVAVVLHDLTLAARFCDQAVLLDSGGRLAATGPVAESLAPEVLGRVFGVDFLQVSSPDGFPVLLPTAPAEPGRPKELR